MKPAELAAIVRGLGPVLREQLRARDARIEALEQRLAALEANSGEKQQPKPRLIFKGTYRDLEDDVYREGDAVLHGGRLWRCRHVNRSAPPGADDGLCWALADGPVSGSTPS